MRKGKGASANFIPGGGGGEWTAKHRATLELKEISSYARSVHVYKSGHRNQPGGENLNTQKGGRVQENMIHGTTNMGTL